MRRLFHYISDAMMLMMLRYDTPRHAVDYRCYAVFAAADAAIDCRYAAFRHSRLCAAMMPDIFRHYATTP